MTSLPLPHKGLDEASESFWVPTGVRLDSKLEKVGIRGERRAGDGMPPRQTAVFPLNPRGGGAGRDMDIAGSQGPRVAAQALQEHAGCSGPNLLSL